MLSWMRDGADPPLRNLRTREAYTSSFNKCTTKRKTMMTLTTTTRAEMGKVGVPEAGVAEVEVEVADPRGTMMSMTTTTTTTTTTMIPMMIPTQAPMATAELVSMVQ